MSATVTSTQATNPVCVLQKIETFTYENRDVPDIGPFEVLVNVHWTGLCGSDAHYALEGRIGDFVVKDPLILGHESSGIIVKVGVSVKSLAKGDKVAIEPGRFCMRCDYCKGGQYNLCRNVEFFATPPYDGTFQQYVAVYEDFCFKLPSNMSLEEGALMEPLAVAVRLCRQAQLRASQHILIFGAGPIGLLCGAIAHAYNASSITIVDIQQHRLDFAVKHNYATHIFNPPRPPAGLDKMEGAKVTATAIKKFSNLGLGADCVIDATGAEPCILAGLYACRPGGIYVQGGMGKPVIEFPIGEVLTNEITLKSAFRYNAGCFKEAVDLASRGQVDVKALISHHIEFDHIADAFDKMKRADPDVIKILVKGIHDK